MEAANDANERECSVKLDGLAEAGFLDDTKKGIARIPFLKLSFAKQETVRSAFDRSEAAAAAEETTEEAQSAGEKQGRGGFGDDGSDGTDL